MTAPPRELSAEQRARDLLSQMGMLFDGAEGPRDPQTMSAGELVHLANALRDAEARAALAAPAQESCPASNPNECGLSGCLRPDNCVRTAAPAQGEPPAPDDLVQRLRDVLRNWTNVTDDEQSVIREAADLIEQQAREIAKKDLRIRELESWRVAVYERAERAEAEQDALRECVRAADAMRDRLYKPRGDIASIEAYDAARAKVQP